MGAKTWMLVYADENAVAALRGGHQLDRDATLQLAKSLFPKEKLDLIGQGDLSYTCPPDDELHAGCFPNVSILAAKEFGLDYPSKLPVSFIRGRGTVYLHAMHSVVDWFAFAQWTNGQLVRSLSLSPDSGILEDIGQRLPFEEPFWSGQHPATDDDQNDYPFPFHPLDLGEAVLKEFFGTNSKALSIPRCLNPNRYRWSNTSALDHGGSCGDTKRPVRPVNLIQHAVRATFRVDQKSSIVVHEGEPSESRVVQVPVASSRLAVRARDETQF